MQTLTKMNKVVIGHYYHVTIMDENENWMKLAHLLSILSLNLEAPFYASTFTSRFLKAFLNVHTRENLYLSLMRQIIPLLSLTLVCTCIDHQKNCSNIGNKTNGGVE